MKERIRVSSSVVEGGDSKQRDDLTAHKALPQGCCPDFAQSSDTRAVLFRRYSTLARPSADACPCTLWSVCK